MTISPGYFDVFKIPVKRGRAFTDRDDSVAPPVVIINEAMAKQFWPDRRSAERSAGDRPRRDARVRRRAASGRSSASSATRATAACNSDPGPAMYIPQAQVPDAANALNVGLSPMAWVVRTAGEPHAMSAAIQEELRQATGLPVSDVRSMGEVVSRRPRASASTCG